MFVGCFVLFFKKTCGTCVCSHPASEGSLVTGAVLLCSCFGQSVPCGTLGISTELVLRGVSITLRCDVSLLRSQEKLLATMSAVNSTAFELMLTSHLSSFHS